MNRRIEWRHAFQTNNPIELLNIALETMSAPTTPVEVPHRNDRRRTLRQMRRSR